MSMYITSYNDEDDGGDGVSFLMTEADSHLEAVKFGVQTLLYEEDGERPWLSKHEIRVTEVPDEQGEARVIRMTWLGARMRPTTSSGLAGSSRSASLLPA